MTGEPITDDRPGKWGQTECRCYKNLAALSRSCGHSRSLYVTYITETRE